ncbi:MULTISPECIES: hypothetical protein [unclassified Nonomuraea]|uniref:hypothetical protein n=1 Tax=unclassified Nonomuraea TaxID=2593643 RepID=UPI001376725D|nr:MULTISPECIES: hypothetical protein [unclassified Nonomuraea]NBE95678.1 hypothetical protein [Nonomuraea sp. K271]
MIVGWLSQTIRNRAAFVCHHPIDFTDRGDPARAPIGVFEYKADNSSFRLAHILGERPA